MANRQCSVCRRKFKSHQGLGGHLSGPCGNKIRSKSGSIGARKVQEVINARQDKAARTVKLNVTRTGGTGFGAGAQVSGLPHVQEIASLRSLHEAAEKKVAKAQKMFVDAMVGSETKKPGIKAESILEEAQRLVYGDRNKDYGHPLDDFSRTGEMATGLFRKKLRPGQEITAEDVGMFMILIKLSRQMNAPKRDNMVDTAGYAGTVQMCIEERARRGRA